MIVYFTKISLQTSETNTKNYLEQIKRNGGQRELFYTVGRIGHIPSTLKVPSLMQQEVQIVTLDQNTVRQPRCE